MTAVFHHKSLVSLIRMPHRTAAVRRRGIVQRSPGTHGQSGLASTGVRIAAV